MTEVETRHAPFPPFTEETARQEVRAAEDAWNSHDPARVALAYTPDSSWRNCAEFIEGRAAIEAFLVRISGSCVRIPPAAPSRAHPGESTRACGDAIKPRLSRTRGRLMSDNTGSISRPSLSGAVEQAARIAPALAAILLGTFLVLGVGFAHSDTLHNAAHDSRHSFAFPCH